VYDTARAALQALTDDELFERVAVKVLFPEFRITGPSRDLNRDAFGRPVSASTTKKYGTRPAHERSDKAIFVTNRSTKQTIRDALAQARQPGAARIVVIERGLPAPGRPPPPEGTRRAGHWRGPRRNPSGP